MYQKQRERCSEEEKAMCMAHFDANGKFMKKTDCKMACCAADGMMRKEVSKQISIQKEEVNGKVKATVKITSEVSGKATTEEKLGFTGDGLGISAHAVCIIKNV